MAWHRLGILVAVGWLISVRALPWDGPSSTTSVLPTDASVSVTSSQSVAPTPAANLDTTATYEPANLCGYIDYSSQNSYTCGGTNTCLWNSKLKLVGCGVPTSVNFYTTCVPYRLLDACDSACFANPSIMRCGREVPHCVTPRVGPEGNYSMFACQATRVFGRYKVHMTYTNQTSIGHIPRFLGEDGNITYATLTPTPKPESTSSGTATVSTYDYTFPGFGESQTLVLAPTAGTESGRHWNETGNAGRNRTCGRRCREARRVHRIQIIVGSVFGSCMGIIVLGVGIWFAIAWKRVKKEGNREGDEKGGGSGSEEGGGVVGALGSSGSGADESGGREDEETEISRAEDVRLSILSEADDRPQTQIQLAIEENPPSREPEIERDIEDTERAENQNGISNEVGALIKGIADDDQHIDPRIDGQKEVIGAADTQTEIEIKNVRLGGV